MSISNDGLLEIDSNASAGMYTITATSGTLSDSMQLEVKEAGAAVLSQITGPEEIVLGEDGAYTYKVLPIADTGSILPQKEVEWSIEGDAKGAVLDETGTLTPGTQTGKITIKGTIVENNLSATLDVYIRSNDEITNAPVDVRGMILYSKELDIANTSVTDIAVKSSAEIQNASVIIKAFDKYDLTTAYSKQNVGTIKDEAYSIKLPEKVELGEAVGTYVMILDADGNVVSKETVITDKGIYKGLPLVGDWYTNEDVGIGTDVNGGPPAGVDPTVTNTSSYGVKYTYDNNYPEIETDNMLWYKTGAYNSKSNIYQQHSDDWEQQALPIGNGYLGGMVFGMPSKDQIQFNEETMWLGGYRGMQEEKSTSYMNPYMGEGPNSYVNGGNLFIDFGLGADKTVNNYYRDLNLDEGVQHVSYTYNGVAYSREYFASYPAQTIVMRYTADKAGSLTFDVKPVMAHPGEISTKNGEITIVGRIKDSEPYYGGGQVKKNIESDLEYCTKIKVVAEGGTVTDEYGYVNVADADAVTIYLTAATDYDPNQFEIGADGNVDLEAKQYKHKDGVAYAIKKAEERLAKTNDKTYDELKSEHIADYKSLFDRVHFSLTDENEICQTPTNELQSQYRSAVNAQTNSDGLCRVTYDQEKYDALNKHFEELYYNYGRYMMISSPRQDNIPANLQGKWCQSAAELWGSGFTLNINLEMNL